MHAYGRGTTQDFQAAGILFSEVTGTMLRLCHSCCSNVWRQAAHKGHAPSANMLAKMYVHGQGFETNYELALSWFRLAAESGDERVTKEAQSVRCKLPCERTINCSAFLNSTGNH